MKIKRFVLFAIIMILSFACQTEDKSDLIAKYEQIKIFVHNRNFEEIKPLLSAESLVLLNALENPDNLNFDDAKAIGFEYDIPLSCLVYNHEMGESIKNKTTQANFLEYLGLTELPIFSWFFETKLLEERTVSAGKGQIVLAMITPAQKQITRSIQFDKADNGEYKLDLVSLLRYREHLLNEKFITFLQSEEATMTENSKKPSKELSQMLNQTQFNKFIMN